MIIKDQLSALFENIIEVYEGDDFEILCRCTRDFKQMFKKGDYYIWSMKSQSSNGDDWDSHSGANTPYIGITGESIFRPETDSVK